MFLIIIFLYCLRFWFCNYYVNIIYLAFFCKVLEVAYECECLEFFDGDFLDIDWFCMGSDKFIIGLYGLEGFVDCFYIRGMVCYFNEWGWDVLGLNFWGCSGEFNCLLCFYYIGEIGDFCQVIDYVLSFGCYWYIGLVGFSLGGNVILKYLGEGGFYLDELVGGVVFLVFCDVKLVNIEIDKWYNWYYWQCFM